MNNKLNRYDYELLEFIKNRKNPTREEILKKFPDDDFGTEYRLSSLEHITKPGYISIYSNLKIPDDEVGYIIIDKRCHLTSKGYKVLIDYKAAKRKNLLKYLDNFVFRLLPLVISFWVAYETL